MFAQKMSHGWYFGNVMKFVYLKCPNTFWVHCISSIEFYIVLIILHCILHCVCISNIQPGLFRQQCPPPLLTCGDHKTCRMYTAIIEGTFSMPATGSLRNHRAMSNHCSSDISSALYRFCAYFHWTFQSSCQLYISILLIWQQRPACYKPCRRRW